MTVSLDLHFWRKKKRFNISKSAFLLLNKNIKNSSLFPNVLHVENLFNFKVFLVMCNRKAMHMWILLYTIMLMCYTIIYVLCQCITCTTVLIYDKNVRLFTQKRSHSDETLNRGPRLRITFLCWWDQLKTNTTK